MFVDAARRPKAGAAVSVDPAAKLTAAALLAVCLVLTLDVGRRPARQWCSSCCSAAAAHPAGDVLARTIPIWIAAPLTGLTMALYGQPAGHRGSSGSSSGSATGRSSWPSPPCCECIAIALPAVALFITVDPTRPRGRARADACACRPASCSAPSPAPGLIGLAAEDRPPGSPSPSSRRRPPRPRAAPAGSGATFPRTDRGARSRCPARSTSSRRSTAPSPGAAGSASVPATTPTACADDADLSAVVGTATFVTLTEPDAIGKVRSAAGRSPSRSPGWTSRPGAPRCRTTPAAPVASRSAGCAPTSGRSTAAPGPRKAAVGAARRLGVGLRTRCRTSRGHSPT